MANFPALEPTARSYDLGSYPITVQPGWAGGSVRFRHGTNPAGHRLTLGFDRLSAADAKLIRDHYRGQLGGMLSFGLSSAVWSGHATLTDVVSSATRWRYASPPEETHHSGSLIDVAVELQAMI